MARLFAFLNAFRHRRSQRSPAGAEPRPVDPAVPGNTLAFMARLAALKTPEIGMPTIGRLDRGGVGHVLGHDRPDVDADHVARATVPAGRMAQRESDNVATGKAGPAVLSRRLIEPKEREQDYPPDPRAAADAWGEYQRRSLDVMAAYCDPALRPWSSYQRVKDMGRPLWQ